MGGTFIRFALAGITAATLGMGAHAADLLPVKAPPVYAAPADWSGFYIGINGGGGWARTPLNESSTEGPGVVLNLSGIDMNGFVVGGHFGYNWQYYSRVVAGFEVDADFADIKGSTSGSVSGVVPGLGGLSTFSATLGSKASALGTARARIGWLATDWLLVYGTGGLAWERFEQSASFTEVIPGGTTSSIATAPSNQFGFVVGVGAEAKVFGSNNWLARVEYLHYDFGNLGNQVVTSLGTSTTLTSSDQTIDLVRGGITYKFTP